VLTGDFNSDPDEETMQIIEKSGLTDSWCALAPVSKRLLKLSCRIGCGDGGEGYTFDSGKPFKRIDYLWCASQSFG
jgi:endonuclease/exonuclease/phosphatase family metal-dependent hydrolase